MGDLVRRLGGGEEGERDRHFGGVRLLFRRGERLLLRRGERLLFGVRLLLRMGGVRLLRRLRDLERLLGERVRRLGERDFLRDTDRDFFLEGERDFLRDTERDFLLDIDLGLDIERDFLLDGDLDFFLDGDRDFFLDGERDFFFDGDLDFFLDTDLFRLGDRDMLLLLLIDGDFDLFSGDFDPSLPEFSAALSTGLSRSMLAFTLFSLLGDLSLLLLSFSFLSSLCLLDLGFSERLDLDLDLDLDFLRLRPRLLERERLLDRCLSLDLFLWPLDLDRFLDLDLERFLDLDLRLFPRDLDLDLRLRPLDLDRDLLLECDLDLPLFLSFDNIPITGSIAADIKFWASLTRVIASSISLCAASFDLACGFSMFTVECPTVRCLPPSSTPFNFNPLMMLVCSENSIRAKFTFGSESFLQNLTYLTSPAFPKKSIICWAVTEGSKLPIRSVRRISSIFTES